MTFHEQVLIDTDNEGMLKETVLSTRLDYVSHMEKEINFPLSK